ncbi:hypothetical protein BDV11DRAFT_171530 [Aspergillus similis]
MEAYFQYRRIQRAVSQELAELEKARSCNGDVGQRSQNISAPSSSAYSKENPSDESIIYVHWSSDDDKLNPAKFSIGR